ncbi:MAG: DEAD/DEAH box helicase [Candidatus Thorarchaeota archaeon]
MQFTDFNLTPNILKSLRRIGFEKPTVIQQKSIPEALLGKDIIGQSQTGSGKTAAFGLPIIQNIRPGKKLQALVLTPTRELCIQDSEALQSYAFDSKIRSETVYGGVGYNPQISALKHAEIVVATPGRLLDHIQQGNTNFSNIRFLVLDEADKMFEMGFLDDVKKILSYIPKKRQTFLFSATFPYEVEKLMDQYLVNPVFLETDQNVSEKFLKQRFYEISSDNKLGLLLYLLKTELKDQNTITFCGTRKETDYLTQNLKKNGINAQPIHGGHSQAKRLNSINQLHEGKLQVLVATDVAARGLDIRNVSYIVNWDIPSTEYEYIHRIGRTARAGDTGYAISLVTTKDFDSFSRILLSQSKKIDFMKNPKFKSVRMIRGNHSRNNNYSNGRSERPWKKDRRNYSKSQESNHNRRRSRDQTSLFL